MRQAIEGQGVSTIVVSPSSSVEDDRLDYWVDNPDEAECDACGAPAPHCIGGTHYYCDTHEAVVAAMHRARPAVVDSYGDPAMRHAHAAPMLFPEYDETQGCAVCASQEHATAQCPHGTAQTLNLEGDSP